MAGELVGYRARMIGLAQVLGFRVSLFRVGMGSGAIQALNRVLALVLSIVLARGLGTESYGIYAYSFAIMSLAVLIAQLGFPTLLVREVAASHGRREWGLLRGVLLRGGQFVAVASLLVAAVGAVALLLRRKGLGDEEFYTLLIMFTMLPATALGKAMLAGLQGLQRVLLGQSVELVLRPLLVLVLVSTFFILWPGHSKAHYAMGIQFAVAIAVLLVAALLVLRCLPEETHNVIAESRDRDWLRSALTFTLIAGAGIINTQVDVIMLGWIREPAEVGIYRVAAQCAVFTLFAMRAASAVLAPRFSNLYSQGNIESMRGIFRKSSVIVGLFSLGVFFLFLFFGAHILQILFGIDYMSASIPLAILAAGYSMNALCGPVGLLLQMVGREAMTARVLWGTAILNIALNSVLIPVYGTTGAASATASSVALYHLILRFKAWRFLGI